MTKRVLTRSELDQINSMWDAPGLKPTLIAVLAAFGGWSLLLPTIPQAILDGGGTKGVAGAYTGVFMAATVLTQTQTPRLLRSLGYSTTMFISGLFLSVPTLLHLFGTDTALVLFVAVLRGMGFGALTVAESALIAELVPLKFLGKASGTLGLAVGIAQLVFLPLGLIIADALGGYAAVYIVGAAVSLVGSLMALLIPRSKSSPKQGKAAVDRVDRENNVPTWKLVLVPALSMSAIAMGFGGISSFLAPAARELDPVAGAVVGGFALSVIGGAQMVFRYLSGIYADRQGRAGLLLVPALVSGVVGLVFIAGISFFGWSPWLIFLAALVYGAGFGIVQNEALLLMFARLPRERNAEASAYWNISFDSGTGIGSFLLGFIAGVALHPYPAVFAVASCLVMVGVIIAFMDRVVGRHRVAEYHNTRATLRKLGGAATQAVRTRRKKNFPDKNN